jgi:Ca2+-binding EF-hand superfamily protein
MGCLIGKTPALVRTSALADLQDKFMLKESELRKLWRLFHEADFDQNSTVSVVEIFRLIKEKPDSVIAPYLIEYISDLEKEEGERLTFEQFTRSVAKYCLLTPTQLLQCNPHLVVFQCIDENRNGVVTKEEIMLFLRAERDGKMIFPDNYIKAIELFETNRSDTIDWSKSYLEEFVRLVKEVPYLSFPAFRLQETLRLYTLGARTWSAIERRLRKRQREAKAKDEEAKKRKDLLQEQVWKFQSKLELNELNESARSFVVKKAKPQGRRVKRSATIHVI